MHQQSPPDPAADDDEEEPDDYDDDEEERERNSVQFTAICLSASPFQIFFPILSSFFLIITIISFYYINHNRNEILYDNCSKKKLPR